jgi:hypothetical protein
MVFRQGVEKVHKAEQHQFVLLLVPQNQKKQHKYKVVL